MPKINVGDTMPNFSIQTPYQNNTNLKKLIGNEKTAIIFLRYYGCTLCQYDIHQYTLNYDEIIKEGGELLVVLQSDPQKLSIELKENKIPFEIICDPNQELYKNLSIEVANSKEDMIDEFTIEKIVKAKEYFSHGEYEGEELQLPATFVVDEELKVVCAIYGKSVSDVPTPEQLKDLLKNK